MDGIEGLKLPLTLVPDDATEHGCKENCASCCKGSAHPKSRMIDTNRGTLVGINFNASEPTSSPVRFIGIRPDRAGEYNPYSGSSTGAKVILICRLSRAERELIERQE